MHLRRDTRIARRDNGTKTPKRDCYVIQFRDGSLLRDTQGRIQFRYSLSAAHKMYLDLIDLPQGLRWPDLSYFERKRAANFPKIVSATDCSEASATPIAVRYGSVPRPHPPLPQTNETALRLLARARQSEDARAVAHDYLFENYSEYRSIVAEAGRASRKWLSSSSSDKDIRVAQIVWVSPTALIETFDIIRRRPVSQLSTKRNWRYAVTFEAEPHGGWPYHTRGKRLRSWIPLFRIPAAVPSERPASRRDRVSWRHR